MGVRVRETDGSRFDKRYEKCRDTINDRIETMLRASSPEDLREVSSTAIKARAKKIINDELGINYVQEVLVSAVDYNVQ